MTNNSLNVQLDIACDQLRKVINNQRKEVDVKTAWVKMSLTSTIKRNRNSK